MMTKRLMSVHISTLKGNYIMTHNGTRWTVNGDTANLNTTAMMRIAKEFDRRRNVAVKYNWEVE